MSFTSKFLVVATGVTLILFTADNFLPGKVYSSQIISTRIQHDQILRKRGMSSGQIEKFVIYFDDRLAVIEDDDVPYFRERMSIEYEVSSVFKVLSYVRTADHIARINTGEYLPLCVFLSVVCAIGGFLSRNSNPNLIGFWHTLCLGCLAFTWYIFLFR